EDSVLRRVAAGERRRLAGSARRQEQNGCQSHPKAVMHAGNDTLVRPDGHDGRHKNGVTQLPPNRPRRRSPWIMRAILLALAAAAVVVAPRVLKKKPLAVTAIKVERATVRDEVASSSAGEVV